jgi:hypothetical protein
MCYIAKLHKDFINRVFMFVRHSVERVLDVPAFLSVECTERYLKCDRSHTTLAAASLEF